MIIVTVVQMMPLSPLFIFSRKSQLMLTALHCTPLLSYLIMVHGKILYDFMTDKTYIC